MKRLGLVAALAGLLACSSERLGGGGTGGDRGTGGQASSGTGGMVHPTQLPGAGGAITPGSDGSGAAVDSGGFVGPGSGSGGASFLGGGGDRPGSGGTGGSVPPSQDGGPPPATDGAAPDSSICTTPADPGCCHGEDCFVLI
jgi:hypothetical protein